MAERLAVVCSLLKSWLTPAVGIQPDVPEKERDVSKQPHSLLWSPGFGGTLPHGNYPVLEALSAAYRCRSSPNIEEWLEVLSNHLGHAEHLAVWRRLTYELWVLRFTSDRTKAVAFVGRLFSLYPAALACFEGTVFLAGSHHWLPPEFTARFLKAIEESDWPWREQAIGEISMLRTAWFPDDQHCRNIVSRAVALREDVGAPGSLRRVGIAYACVHLWSEPRFRPIAHEFLTELAGAGDGYLPGAIMDVFRVNENMPNDAKTKELLEILATNPELIRRGGPSFLLERLKGLLSAGCDPNIIATTIKALLSAIGPAVGDVRTGWATDAGELIRMSVSLQRYPSTRNAGLEIFETLMDAGAYEAEQMLRDLDRRI
jgi:hypothetical protein